MTEYVKSTNFASKDSLASGNPLKIVKGTEIDSEFNNIATAIATKADLEELKANLPYHTFEKRKEENPNGVVPVALPLAQDRVVVVEAVDVAGLRYAGVVDGQQDAGQDGYLIHRDVGQFDDAPLVFDIGQHYQRVVGARRPGGDRQEQHRDEGEPGTPGGALSRCHARGSGTGAVGRRNRREQRPAQRQGLASGRRTPACR